MRFSAPAAVIIAAMLCVLAGCGPDGRLAYLGGAPHPTQLAKADLEYYWILPAQERLDPGESVTRLWRLDENVYALTNTNRLIAIDAVAGKYKWAYDVAKPGVHVYGPTHADRVSLPPPAAPTLGLTFDPSTVPAINTVLVSTQDYALLINRDKGDLVRKVKFGFAASTPVVSDGSSLFVGAGTGWFYDIRLTDGVQKWAMATGGMITARPEFYARRLYVGSYDNTFRAIDPYIEGQRTVWGQKTAGPISADFSVSSRGCFVSSRDASVYNYDPATGREVWSYRTQKPLVNAAQIGERTVFQYAEGDAFYAIDLATGRLRWPGSPELRTVVGASGRNVYASTRHGLLVTVDEMTGKISSTVMAYGLKLLAPNTDKDAIFAATPSGYFFCIRPKGAAPLTAEALKPVLPKG